ncbi:retrovirus-related pol polyprotein from transposon TNT 1-94 [Tanacetum coccineum]
MLATGRYAQWRSRFLRYIDTRPNGDALRKCILKGPYTPTIVTTQLFPQQRSPPAVPKQTTVETVMNMTPENRAHFESEKEAIHLILTGIGDEIYSTVDACQTAQEMWEAIERLQQGSTKYDEMIRNNLTVATCSQCSISQQLQPNGHRFVTNVKQQHKLDEVSYHKLFDILKQYQKEVNELRAERIAKNAIPLALVATAHTLQDPYYQTSKSHKSYAPTSKASLPTRFFMHTDKYKGKEKPNPITPPSESASEEDSDPEQAQKDKDMQKNLALIAKYFKKLYKPTNNNLKTSSNTRNKNVDTTPRYKNDNQTGHLGNQRAVNVIGGPVVQQSGIQCFNCKEFGHYAKECRKPKRVKDSTYHKEKMLLCKQAEKGVQLQAEQSDWLADTDEEIDEQELEAHYSYMAKIQEVPNADSGTDSEPLEQVQYDTDDNVFANDIQHFDQSESISNTCAKWNGDSKSLLTTDMCDNEYSGWPKMNIQKQLKKANATLTQELTECKSILAETSRTLGESNIDYDKLEHKLNEALGLLAQKEIDIKEGLKVKACEISIVKEKHDELVKQSLLTKSHYEGLVKEKTKTRLSSDREETQTLDAESRSKLNKDLVKPFDYIKLNNLKYVESLEDELDKLESDKQNFPTVAHKTNVSRPQPRSNQMKDKVMPNTSHVKFKKTEVEEHPRISSISNQTKSVTACNDSLNSRTSNVNAVSATFTRKPKGQANKSAATPHKKTVASESTVTNSMSYYMMLYKKTNKAWKWWIAQQCPSTYTWVPKTKWKWVPKVRNENVTKQSHHNLFSVGQFCDADLEVAFRKSTCFVRDLQGNDLLTDNRRTDLYTISLQETTSSIPICLMAKASPSQAWLWHRRLSHLNFDYINLLSKKDVVIGLPKLKYVKDQLCSSCEASKAKRSSFKSKTVPSSKGRNLQAPVISVRTDRGTEFLNKTLNAFFKEEGIEHQTSTPRTPEQNGIVERRNRTLVEAARTMLSASKLPLFFWAEAIATACYTQNRSIIIPTHEKMAYHIINDRKPSIKHLHIFGCTCYLTRDGENLDKMKEKGDPCILVGYSTQSKGYRVYNKRTKLS